MKTVRQQWWRCVGTLGRVMRRFRSDSRLHTVAWAETGLGLDYRLGKKIL